MLATILVIEVPKDVSAQVTEEWVVRYTGPGSGADRADAMALDSSGNIYVTGLSDGNGTGLDYVTIKYDSDGNEIWSARYNGPGNSDDSSRDIALDNFGNVYVTGASAQDSNPPRNRDYATAAYDSNGNELWVALYNSSGNSEDWALAITTDPLGNVFVTGTSGMVAYNSTGHELWVDEGCYGHDITTDSSGNIYVTGHKYYGLGPQFDYLTIAYDSSGHRLWSARYDYSRFDDIAQAITMDLLGNVYITGGSIGIGHSSDYATVAYDSLGNELWVARYDGPTLFAYDVAYDITTDQLGNVYVTGKSGRWPNWDYATVAYDSYGNELWTSRYNGVGNGEDWAWVVTTDPLGNIYVTGESEGNGTEDDYATIAYDSYGNELWIARYDGPASSIDRAYDMACDPLGNVYVTGLSFGSRTNYDFTTIKYTFQGKQILQATINIDPDTLNLKSKGRWITAYITLNSPYDLKDIDIGKVMLDDTIPAEWGDIQDDTLMVKFDRSEVEDLLSPGTYNLKVTGELTDGTKFEGYSDEITVINPPKK
jgi:hypothetical protein